MGGKVSAPRPAAPHGEFHRLHQKVGRFRVTGKTLLIPEMGPFATRLVAASFRAFGVPAAVMETYRGLSIAKEFTSGKECFPCQVTLGDLLYCLRKEKDRLGAAFSAADYVYFLPESEGPCRFGMYGKFQGLVLDRFPELRDIRIAALSSEDCYSLDGLLEPRAAGSLKKLILSAIVYADLVDRMVWRVRPYEKDPGSTDALAEDVARSLESAVEHLGARLDFATLDARIEEAAIAFSGLADLALPRRTRIGVIGEIFVRSHPDSNEHIIRQIERFGGEVVNASIAEWVTYIAYDRARTLRGRMIRDVRRRHLRRFAASARMWLPQRIESFYMVRRRDRIYARVLRHLDVQPDHSTAVFEQRLAKDRIFSFDVGTESALSIGAALQYVHDGFDGVVQVFPFTCIPGATSSAILKPLLRDMGIPYFEAAYDGTAQPNREIGLRTFLYQAGQHRQLPGKPSAPRMSA